MNNQPSPTTVTFACRFSYLNCWEPKAAKPGQDEKYSVSAIIPKSDTKTLDKIKAAIEAAKQLGKESKWGGKIPTNLKLPLRDGDDERDDDSYKGAMFLNANATTQPGIVDSQRNPIMNKEDVYSGAYGFLNVNFYPFDSNGSKGVAVSFNHLMKTKDGERLSGRISVDDAFEGIETEDEGADSFM